MTGTRLDRLLSLLQTGKTEASRLAAAKQIGDVQRQHPQQLHQLLQRVLSYLFSSDWDTRRAAAAALEAIAEAVPAWQPYHPSEVDDAAEEAARTEAEGAWLTCDSFDMCHLLRFGAPLLASGGQEFELEEANEKPRERLLRQRKLLQERLGMDARTSKALGPSDAMEGLLEERDLEPKGVVLCVARSAAEEAAAREVSVQLDGSGGELSARARNALRRRLKQRARDTASSVVPLAGSDVPPEGLPTKRQRTTVHDAADASGIGRGDARVIVEVVGDDEEVEWLESPQWPFEPLCAELRCSLFHAKWYRRHGAAAGLRAMLKLHAATAGSVGGVRQCVSKALQAQWVTDCGIRLLCVLALDRFGDWASGDKVTAPVRETAAQALSVLLLPMSAAVASAVATGLLEMAVHETWEVRHGALLGLKYVLAMRADLLPDLLPRAGRSLLTALTDADDDVRCVAAETLGGVARHFHSLLGSLVPELLATLWDSLVEVDDLAASSVSVMKLLAECCNVLPYSELAFFRQPHGASVRAARVAGSSMVGDVDMVGGTNLVDAVSRLWAFLRHPSAAARVSALNTLQRLLSAALAAKQPAAWLSPQLPAALHLLFEALLLDPDSTVHDAAFDTFSQLLVVADTRELVMATAPQLTGWLGLACTPAGSPLPALSSKPLPGCSQGVATGTATYTRLPDAVVTDAMHERAANALSALAHASVDDILSWIDCLGGRLSSCSATCRQVTAWVVAGWARAAKEESLLRILRDSLQPALLALASESDRVSSMSSELQPFLGELQASAASMLNAFIKAGVLRDGLVALWPGGAGAALGLPSALALSTTVFAQWIKMLPPQTTAAVRHSCTEQRERLVLAIRRVYAKQEEWRLKLGGAAAEALVCMNALPAQLNPVIRSLMRAVESAQPRPQARAASALAQLVGLLRCRTPNHNGMHPNDKVVGNLCKLLVGTMSSQSEAPATENGSAKEERAAAAACAAEGAKCTLHSCCQRFGDETFDAMPMLWTKLEQPLFAPELAMPAALPELQQALTLVVVLLPKLSAKAAAATLSLLRSVFTVVTAELLPDEVSLGASSPCSSWSSSSCKLSCGGGRLGASDLRELAALAVASFCDALEGAALESMITELLPCLAPQQRPNAQLGAILSLRRVVDALQMRLLPYAALLLTPLIGSLSVKSERQRIEAGATFAQLMPLLPLEPGAPNPPTMSEALLTRKQDERRFVAQLLGTDGSKPLEYKIAVRIDATLRHYQQEGVNWLAFLKRFGLHGILCDDMGLGKTLQTLCLLASNAQEQRQQATGRSDAAPLPSLVICPTTLTGHWIAEVRKFCGNGLRTLEYVGSTAQRERLFPAITAHELVVTSYDVLRNDISALRSVQWDYCVLDEGHIIKNARSKTTIAVKGLPTRRRLLLSGTPLQNNALELWSLFDFLMPGYLGTQAQFHQEYSRPIQASFGSRVGASEQLAGEEALRRLHRQVLPFCLRRTKETVLSELPPKIIEDRICDLHPLQRRLYTAFAQSQARQGVTATIEAAESSEQPVVAGAKHVFAALQHLRKLCNHPLLAIGPTHHLRAEYETAAQAEPDGLHSLAFSPKLLALQQILLDCGIGAEVGGAALSLEDCPTTGSVAVHRALVFCQSREMLDLVANDLLSRCMPTVSYLRLDGRVPASQRFELVTQFNSDPSLDVMLLTTSVGGLGLNLTSADVVIFVDHDWNPMKDLQAMDRAHRIGQQRVVSVFRLITRDTLEEKIMGLQQFKLHIAHSVVNDQNAALDTMGTEQLLELFDVSPATAAAPPSEHATPSDANGSAIASTFASGGGVAASSRRKSPGLQAMLDEVGELWGDEQYLEEYDLQNFLRVQGM